MHGQFLNDDAYITLTYAKNFGSGRGFVFGSDIPSFGFTSPLWTLLLGIAYWITGIENLDRLASVLGGICWSSAILIIFRYRQSWGLSSPIAFMVCLVISLAIPFITLGMESHLFTLLLVLSITLFLNNQPLWTGISIGLLHLTRGEGVLLAPILFGFYVSPQVHYLKSRIKDICRWTLTISVGFLLPVLTWSTYAILTFGHVFPNTLKAKQAQLLTTHWSSFSHRLFREWLPNWGSELTIAGVPIGWFLLAIGAAYMILRARASLILFAWMVIYIAGYAVLRVAGYAWYQLPILFVLQFILGVGIGVLFAQIFERRHILAKVSFSCLTLIFLSLLITPFSKTVLNFRGDYRARDYINLSEWLSSNTETEDSVAAIEIGYIAYFSKRPVVDLAGLVDPEITAHIIQGDFSSGFWNALPEYFIWMNQFRHLLGGIRRSPCFKNYYKLVNKIPLRRGVAVIYQRINSERPLAGSSLAQICYAKPKPRRRR
jgi:hypothetical protein